MPRLIRDCPATAIPAGNEVTLPPGLEVVVTQTLGGNITIRTELASNGSQSGMNGEKMGLRCVSRVTSS